MSYAFFVLTGACMQLRSCRAERNRRGCRRGINRLANIGLAGQYVDKASFVETWHPRDPEPPLEPAVVNDR